LSALQKAGIAAAGLGAVGLTALAVKRWKKLQQEAKNAPALVTRILNTPISQGQSVDNYAKSVGLLLETVGPELKGALEKEKEIQGALLAKAEVELQTPPITSPGIPTLPITSPGIPTPPITSSEIIQPQTALPPTSQENKGNLETPEAEVTRALPESQSLISQQEQRRNIHQSTIRRQISYVIAAMTLTFAINAGVPPSIPVSDATYLGNQISQHFPDLSLPPSGFGHQFVNAFNFANRKIAFGGQSWPSLGGTTMDYSNVQGQPIDYSRWELSQEGQNPSSTSARIPQSPLVAPNPNPNPNRRKLTSPLRE
jgi:hypothetical protein